MVDTSTLAEFAGKDVVITIHNEDGDDEQIEGKVEQASDVGIAFKRRGRRDVEAIFPDALVDIHVAEKKPTKLKQRSLLPVEADKVRSHLVQSHGYFLSVVNGYSNEEAEKEHDSIDHSDLGHNHDKEPESDEAEAE